MATINSTNTPQLTTNGQIIVGSTGAFPVATTLTGASGIVITNGAGSITAAINVSQTNVAANSNTTFTLVSNTSNYYKVTFTSNCTIAFTFPSGEATSMVVQLINAGAFTVAFSSLLWAGGAAPTFTSSGTDMIVVWQNGDNIKYGALIGKAFA